MIIYDSTIFVHEKYSTSPSLSHRIRMPPYLFKMDWLLMSIVLLCIMATILYSLISLLEKWCTHRF